MLPYTDSGEIWNGDAVPNIDDPLHVAILTELLEQQEIVNEEDLEVIGEPWIIKVPTNLVKLNASLTPELPDNSATLIE